MILTCQICRADFEQTRGRPSDYCSDRCKGLSAALRALEGAWAVLPASALPELRTRVFEIVNTRRARCATCKTFVRPGKVCGRCGS